MKGGRSKGHTLLELLTGVAIMLIVCGFVLKISSQALDLWGNASEEINNGSELKLVLDIIEKDLETSLPYYRIDYAIKDKLESIERLCFYVYGENDVPNIIVYEIIYDELKNEYRIYRYERARTGNKRYEIGENLDEALSREKLDFNEVIKSSTLLAKSVKGLSVNFFYRNAQGKMEWSTRAPFSGTAIGIDVIVIRENNEELSRRITLVGVTRL